MKASVSHLQTACRHLSRARQAFASRQYHVAELQVTLAQDELRRVIDGKHGPKRDRRAAVKSVESRGAA